MEREPGPRIRQHHQRPQRPPQSHHRLAGPRSKPPSQHPLQNSHKLTRQTGRGPSRHHHRPDLSRRFGESQEQAFHDQRGRHFPHEGPFQSPASDSVGYEVRSSGQAHGSLEQDARDDCKSLNPLFSIPRAYSDRIQGSYSPNTTDKPEYEKKCKSISSSPLP